MNLNPDKKVFIIAEAGVNHNGDLKIAKKLIDVAKQAGADAVKFQTFKAEKIVTRDLPKAKYQMRNTGRRESQFNMLKRLELPKKAFEQLMEYCIKKNIIFMSTPFDEESADFLDNLGMKIFKISSGENTNKPLIQHIANKGKTVMLSTGMSYLSEVRKAVAWINDVWMKSEKNPDLFLLHCVSDYPTKPKDVNLNAMKTLESTFDLPVGLSDHTIGIEIPIAAVAMGARVLEKHFTLDRNMEGPDHKISLEPKDIKEMVKTIRNVEKAMGDGVKRPTKNEEHTKKLVRRSLVASKDIKAGDRVTMSDISIKRPGTGLSPEEINQIVNKKTAVNIKKDTVFKKNHLC